MGGEKTDETGDKGVTNVGTESEGEYHKEEEIYASLKFQAGCWTYWGIHKTAAQTRNPLLKLWKLPLITYFQILITSQLCGMALISFLTMPTTILMYLPPLDWPNIQLTRNPAKPPKTVIFYYKYLPSTFPASYIIVLIYMMSASFLSLLLIL